MVLDFDGGPIAAGDEVKISYGPRSNDVLLQYYGFVEGNNPHDAYALTQQELILALDAASPLPAGAVDALKAAGLTDNEAALSFTAAGASELGIRLARLLTAPQLAPSSDKGRLPLPDAAEAAALRALAAVAAAKRDAMPAAEQVAEQGLGGGGRPTELLSEFVDEKRRTLARAADALRSRADNPAAYAAEEGGGDDGGGGEGGAGGFSLPLPFGLGKGEG